MTLASVLVPISWAIELCSAIVIVVYACRSILAAVPSGDTDAARALLGDGVLTALGFSLCATLLKVIGLENWVQIRTFAAVLLLRTLLKQVFKRETVQRARRRAPALHLQ